MNTSVKKPKSVPKDDPNRDILVPAWLLPFLPYDLLMRDFIMFALWFCINFIVGSLFAVLDYQMLAIGTFCVGSSFLSAHYILRKFDRKRK